MSAGHRPTVRVAAVGDVHFGNDSAGSLRGHLAPLAETADLLLLAGDLTRHGEAAEAEVLARELAPLSIPIYAVLGNHDHHLEQHHSVIEVLEAGGITVLEGTTAQVAVGEATVGIVGLKGFGGGFAGACGTYFGEREMKAFIGHTRDRAAVLQEQLSGLDTDVRLVLLHYAPCAGTLHGERLEIFPFLGSYLLGEAIDHGGGADAIFHGHAHAGVEKGTTPGGTTVRNVAQHVIRRAYAVYTFHPELGERGMTATTDDDATGLAHARA